MITYKDQTWCLRKCGNEKCFRNYTDLEHERNLNGPDLPLSLADMKTDNCGWRSQNSSKNRGHREGRE